MAALRITAGREVLVKYPEDRPWHRRIVLVPGTAASYQQTMEEAAPRDASIWWVLTPDGDVYPEVLSCPPLERLLLCDSHGTPVMSGAPGEGRRRPAAGQIHDFRVMPSPMQFLEMIESAGREEAAISGQRPPAAAQPPNGNEPAGAGAEAPPPRAEVAPTAPLDNGLGGDAGDEEAGEDLDARVLAITRRPDGVRKKDYKTAVEECRTSDWPGWPLSGPRTAQWCLEHIREVDGHPVAHHSRWKHQAGLSTSDAGVSEHESIMKAIEYALCFDMVCVPELASFELMLRRAQLVEMKYRSRSLRGLTGDVGMEEEHLVLGTSATRGALMIAPLLETFVSAEMGREVSVMKEKRKLREERRLARPNAKGNPKGKGKGEDAAEAA